MLAKKYWLSSHNPPYFCCTTQQDKKNHWHFLNSILSFSIPDRYQGGLILFFSEKYCRIPYAKREVRCQGYVRRHCAEYQRGVSFPGNLKGESGIGGGACTLSYYRVLSCPSHP